MKHHHLPTLREKRGSECKAKRIPPSDVIPCSSQVAGAGTGAEITVPSVETRTLTSEILIEAIPSRLKDREGRAIRDDRYVACQEFVVAYRTI